MIRRLLAMVILCSAGLALTGCAKPLEVASITEIAPTNGAKGVDVYEVRRQKGETVPEFAGDQLVEVRTYADTSDSGQVEMTGAACTVNGRDFTAAAVSPARVRVPLYRGQSSALSITCKKDGFEQRSIVVGAIDVTRNQRFATGSGGGLIGVVVAVTADALADNTKNTWNYGLAQVVMTPQPSRIAQR
jgi:hypothetical protein